jgi:hypothetical protein
MGHLSLSQRLHPTSSHFTQPVTVPTISLPTKHSPSLQSHTSATQSPFTAPPPPTTDCTASTHSCCVSSASRASWRPQWGAGGSGSPCCTCLSAWSEELGRDRTVDRAPCIKAAMVAGLDRGSAAMKHAMQACWIGWMESEWVKHDGCGCTWHLCVLMGHPAACCSGAGGCLALACSSCGPHGDLVACGR